jgi:hypothetical protein
MGQPVVHFQIGCVETQVVTSSSHPHFVATCSFTSF